MFKELTLSNKQKASKFKQLFCFAVFLICKFTRNKSKLKWSIYLLKTGGHVLSDPEPIRLQDCFSATRPSMRVYSSYIGRIVPRHRARPGARPRVPKPKALDSKVWPVGRTRKNLIRSFSACDLKIPKCQHRAKNFPAQPTTLT